MLILCIVGTINLITGIIGKILSFDISGILLYVLEILIVIGMWITFVNAKRKNLSSKGISNQVYGKDVAEIIKDNLKVHVFLGSNNPETFDAFSKECGIAHLCLFFAEIIARLATSDIGKILSA